MEVLLLDTCGQRKLQSLLLTLLFVGNVAADCPIPDGGPNMIPTTGTLLKNDFPDGSEATLECGNGYIKDSGSGILTCLSGIWTEPDLICIKKNCGLPKSQPNMQHQILQGTLFGDIVRVYCDEGYKINGTSYKQCISTGWFGSAQCDIVTCNKPFQVPNGKSSWNTEENPKYKQVVYYSCDVGYTLSGNNSIMCSKTGQYDSQPPECKGVATEDKITAKMVTSVPTSTEPKTLSSTTSSTTATTHRATTITARAPAAVSTSERGCRYLSTAEEKTATTRATSGLSSSFREEDIEAINPNKYNTLILILTVTFVSLVAVVAVVVFFLYKFQQRRKGSYDTREDLKPELLQFQNL